MNRSRPPVLGLSLTFLRALNGWTQAALAKASRTVTSALSQYENGRSRLTQEHYDQLAAVMPTGEGIGGLVTSTVALLLSAVDGDVERPADDLAADLAPHERQAVLASVLHRRQIRMLAAWVDKVVVRLRELHGQIPVPPDLAKREEHRAPRTVAMNLRAAIEGTIHDHLEPAHNQLLAFLNVTEAQLQSQFYAEQMGPIA